MTSWWSVDRIKATINQSYIERELTSKKHQDLLHRVLSFGDGLTDDTYLDWIIERSSRFFLILDDIGVPEKIFEIIDRSFDDDDLPLSQDALWELNLFGTKSETLDKKFYRQQYSYLVQELEPGGHVEYGTWEVVPIHTVAKRAGILANTYTEKVIVNDCYYTRKKIPNSSDSGIDRIRFIMHLKGLEHLHHKHIALVWATYSQDGFNYALLTPCLELTLKSVLDDQSKQMKGMEKHERRRTLLTWIQCLTSAIAYLHNNGLTHNAMRPSTITIDQDNIIYLNEFSALKVLDCDEAANPYSGELYDYAPPENWLRKSRLHETAPSKTLPPGGGRTSRRVAKSSPSLTDNVTPPFQATLPRRTHSKSQSSSSTSASSINQRSRNALITTFAPSNGAASLLPNKYFPADVFSLTAVLLSLLSYLLGHSPKSFASYRSRLNRQAGRGNAMPDSSFHKNLKQVDKWIDLLAKEAGQKEKKDLTFWGAVVELVRLCRSGMQKEPTARQSANKLAKKATGWTDWGLARKRRCSCFHQDQEKREQAQAMNSATKLPFVRRDSALSWGVLSSQYSENDLIPPQSSMRPRRSLSQRKSLDQRPSHHRSGLRRTDSLSQWTLLTRTQSSRKNSDAMSSPANTISRSRKNSNGVSSSISPTSRKASDATAPPGDSMGRHIIYEEDNPHEQLFGKPEDAVNPDPKLVSSPKGSLRQNPMPEKSFEKSNTRREVTTHAIGRAGPPHGEQFDTMSMLSGGGTEVWGLGNALEEDAEPPYERMDWPLPPLGTLNLNHEP